MFSWEFSLLYSRYVISDLLLASGELLCCAIAPQSQGFHSLCCRSLAAALPVQNVHRGFGAHMCSPLGSLKGQFYNKADCTFACKFQRTNDFAVSVFWPKKKNHTFDMTLETWIWCEDCICSGTTIFCKTKQYNKYYTHTHTLVWRWPNT